MWHARLVLSTTKGKVSHSDISYGLGDLLVFGSESKGLPQLILDNPNGVRSRIPMQPGARSLNLANAVGIVVYEAMRQLNYPGLQIAGPSTPCGPTSDSPLMPTTED